MDFDTLTKHIRQLNELEQIKHHQRAQEALKRIKELRERTRAQQETSASANTTRSIS